MIIKCEECGSRFNLDESILKKEGSKVKCSVCENIFTVFPMEPAKESLEDDFSEIALEETVALDSSPLKDSVEPEPSIEDAGDSFDKLFEDALEEDIQESETFEPGEIEEKTVAGKAEQTELLSERPDIGLVTPETIRAGKKKGRAPILLITLVVIFLFIVSALAVFFLAPDYLPDSLSALKPVKKEEITDTGIRRLTFNDVSGSFFQSDMSGQLYIIKGTVTNNNPKSRSFLLLKGTILDANGENVKQKLVYAGNIFTEDQLNNTTLEEIDRELKNQAGKGDINVNVEPGSSVPFMIVFENLPDNLGEFIVEAVSSSPGK
ncbi:zinc-ribbon domain-containing protein [Deltaproteobacteria bacterium]|nr:zinc-ribbon domain-containing protein [Deltaproteobacteria bacterium]